MIYSVTGCNARYLRVIKPSLGGTRQPGGSCPGGCPLGANLMKLVDRASYLPSFPGPYSCLYPAAPPDAAILTGHRPVSHHSQ
jgi:hypothetical protein